MKRKLKKLTPFLVLLFLILWVFRVWFTFKPISAGDWEFLYPESIRFFSFSPFTWDASNNLGKGSLLLLGLGSYYQSTAFLFNQIFKIPWLVAEKIIWFWPFLLLTIFSSWFLVKTLLPKNVFWFFCPFVFLFNTYILMIVGGGQMGIMMAYALAPLVLGLFINQLTSSRVNELKKLVLVGAVLALQVMFDPRIAYITMIGVGLYWIINLLLINELTSFKIVLRSLLYTFVVPGLIVSGLHFYWLLSLVLTKRATLPAGLGEPGWVEFLSFADFSNSLSLLHPNWPENIFGKTYFFRPEFLVLPVLAFISLLFTNKLKNLRVKKDILFFALLALIGAFLAKGANPPFGEIYLWLFKNIPGMNLFRDASKFYVLVALSYSILIPFNISKIDTLLKLKLKQNYLSKVFLLLVVCFLLFLIKPAVLGQLGGTFKIKTVPQDYFQFKDFINRQDDFFRTFWVPKKQRFGFYSNNHPGISSENFLTDTSCEEPFCSLKVEMPENWGEKCFPNDRCYVRELSYFLNHQTAEVLSQMAVKYIIVPFDSEGEIFIAEHQYNHQQREEVGEFLDTIPWLKKIDVAEKIAVYEIPSYKDHFFGVGEEIPEIQWQVVNPTKYLVQVKNARQPFNLVFSETYDELWQARLDSRSARLAKIGGRIIPSMRFNNLNSFSIDQAGDFEIMIEFTAQKYVYWGLVVSAFTLLMSAGVLVYLRLFLVKQRFVCS